jgi:hypothetical protein
VAWSIAAAVPLIGSPFKTTQQITDVVADFAGELLLPIASMGETVSPDRLLDGTRLDLALLQKEQPRLNELATAAATLNAEAQKIVKPAYFSMIDDARVQLQHQVSNVAALMRNAAIAAKLAPSMLGADGPRTYLLGFQNNAEARGTGGLLGGVGVLRFDNGIPAIDALASNAGLEEAVASVDLGPDFDRAYGWTNPYTDFRNSNMSPHFPYAAEIWKSMWEQQSGGSVDGVVALDPVALSYILGATGPVTLKDGEVINEANVVELTQSTAYSRFIPVDRAPRDGRSPEEATRYNNAYAATLRKQYLLQIASAVAEKMTKPLPAPRLLMEALGRAVSEHRISIWSASPTNQELLEDAGLAQVVPDDPAPYAQVVINNLGGNKMDYYLRREIEYAADGCTGDMRNSTVTVRLTNAATDERLPDYVSGLAGLHSDIKIIAPPGTMVSSVRLIATEGARLMSVTVDGKRAAAVIRQERGHPSFEVQIAIPPNQTGELSFQLLEPTSSGVPQVPIQPLIDNLTPRVLVPTCSPKP